MLSTRGVAKSYGPVRALHPFELQVGTQGAEVVSIIGENGAGKSTLLKILSGVHQPTEGEIQLHGKLVELKSPREAIHHGIAMVHQELNLIGTLSAADNLFLGREKGGFVLDRKTTLQEAERLLAKVGAKFKPQTLCENLSIAEQQLVEIAKALAEDAKLVIFDEPTAVLSEVESQTLFSLIRNLKADGVSVLYVSHRLPEVLDLSDRIVVLRDGQKVAEVSPKDLTPADLANLMVGRDLAEVFPPKSAGTQTQALKVEGLHVPRFAHGISFEVKKGEVLGFAGLIGSGRTESAEAIVGLRQKTAGTLSVSGQPTTISRYQQAIQAGIAYISEDRKGRGLHVTMSVHDNINLATLDQNPKESSRAAQTGAWIEKLGIKVSDPALPISSLSGGNQQKVSISKWLATNPSVLILDEPTRGVDVGAKQEIYRVIANLAKDGLACIVISSEMPELIGLCHRIVVFKEGHIVGELTEPNMTESNIMKLAAGAEGAKSA